MSAPAIDQVKSELDAWIARRKASGRYSEDLHIASRRVRLALDADNSNPVMRRSLVQDVARLRIAASTR